LKKKLGSGGRRRWRSVWLTAGGDRWHWLVGKLYKLLVTKLKE